jgi:hypothetical protein
MGSNNHELLGEPGVDGSAHDGRAITPAMSIATNRRCASPLAFIGLICG